MSIRQMFPGSIVKPGFNPLGTQTTTTTYYYYLNSWGNNGTYGILGLNNNTSYSSPKQVGSLTNWSSISTSTSRNIFGIKNDGTLWAWGRNYSGALGLGNITSYSSPKQVGALTNWLSVVSSYGATFAIKTDGTLWSWGYNAQGQLGLGNTTNYSSPKQIGLLTNWLKVSCDNYSVAAIKTNGTIWSWGGNANGELGLSNQTYYSSPKQIGALTTWSNVSKGLRSVIAVKTDGTLWAWGNNIQGQLGLNTATQYYSSPKQVGSLTNWSVNISAQNSSSMAVKNDGTLWGWGQNNSGQLGLGNTLYKSSPNQVGALSNWSTISVGVHAVALKTDGTLWVWGGNNDGNLGLGNTTFYSSPKQLGSNTNWYSAKAMPAGSTFVLTY